MADDHNDDPPNEFAAAFSNSESSNDELEGNNEPAENAQEELAAATLQGTEVEAIVAQEPAVASLQRSTVFQEPAVASLQRSTRFQEPAVMAAHDMPDQPQDREDPGYEDKEMTDSIKGAHDLLYLKHTILDYETARKLEHMKSKILSGIDLNSTSGSKQKALRIQESEATNGAAQGRRELQFEQEEGGGGLFYGNYAPPDLPPITSLENLIQDCSKPFEKQLTPSDVSKTPRLCLNKEYVDNHIKPVLRKGENPNEGIDVTTYDMDGNEYPMKFTTWGTYLYVLSQGWKTFCHDLGLVETQDFLTLWVFRHVNNGGLCFAIHSRRLLEFKTNRSRLWIRPARATSTFRRFQVGCGCSSSLEVETVLGNRQSGRVKKRKKKKGALCSSRVYDFGAYFHFPSFFNQINLPKNTFLLRSEEPL